MSDDAQGFESLLVPLIKKEVARFIIELAGQMRAHFDGLEFDPAEVDDIVMGAMKNGVGETLKGNRLDRLVRISFGRGRRQPCLQ